MDQAAATTAEKIGDGIDIPVPEGAGQDVPKAATAAPKNPVYAGREWTSEHPLNVRMSIPLGFNRYYITVVAGKERRARARLAMDRRQHPLDTPSNALFLFLVGLIVTAGSIGLGYLVLAHIFNWSGRLIF